MDKVTTVGIDLAKRVFALHGVDGVGRVTLRRICQRDELVAVIGQLPPLPDWDGSVLWRA